MRIWIVTLGVPIAALLWATQVALGGVDAGSTSARVLSESLEVYDGADAHAFLIGRLRRGSRIEVRRREGEWLVIEPPSGAFCWVDAQVLQAEPDGTAMILDDRTVVRSGIAGARLPGPPCLALRRGTRVRPLDQRSLSVGDGASRRVWQAIEPPDGFVCYVRSEGVAGHGAEVGASRVTQRAGLSSRSAALEADPGKIALPAVDLDGELATIRPRIDHSLLTPGIAARLESIEAQHRATLRGPLDSWRLDTIQRGYERLELDVADLGVRELIRGRLRHVERQQEAATAAFRFREILTRSRSRDRTVEELVAGDSGGGMTIEEQAYDSIGMLQRSSRLVDGVRVYAVIGSEGHAVAYVKVPPGINAERLVSAQVGVRGEVGYDAGLRAKIINARELIPLGPTP